MGIFSSSEHGGLINLLPGTHYPGTKPELLHPMNGQKFWSVTFANALHASWWSTLNASSTKQPEVIKALCNDIIEADKKRYGFTQLLLDANNAAPTCYYEASSQNLGGHQYMHNPEQFGYFQFSDSANTRKCQNVQWLARFVLAQLYQAEIQYLIDVNTGNGTYTNNLETLLLPQICTIDNACNSSALSLLKDEVHIEISSQTGKTGQCAQYAVGKWQTPDWTGGPCFNVSVAYTVQSRTDKTKSKRIKGMINEAGHISFDENVGQRTNEPDSSWLCLEEVDVVG